MLTGGTLLCNEHSIEVYSTFFFKQMIGDSDPGETKQWLGSNDVLMEN